MAWYSQQNFPEINTDSRSLTVAFSNLLQRFDIYLSPPELHVVLTQDDPIIDWWSVAEYVESLDMGEVYDDASWPTSSNAIIKFQRMDPASAGFVDHYCVIADHRARSIIDSLDGVIKSAAEYGAPVGWASYVKASDLKFGQSDDFVPEPTAPKPGTEYRVLSGGQNCWEIARQVKLEGINGVDIADHNDIDDPAAKLPAGSLVLLPMPLPQDREKQVEFELLEEPLEMHVTRPHGARKYAFGNVKRWKDINTTGPLYPQNTNVTIVAIAHVPIPKDDMDAVFCMDALAVGDFAHTGRIAYMVGFNNAHLAQDHVEPTKPAPKPAVTVKLAEAAKVLEEAEKRPESVLNTPVVVQPTVTAENFWKSTIRPLREDRAIVTYLADETIMVSEMDGKRPPKPLYQNQGVPLQWKFTRDDVDYGLPPSHEKTGLWFGVPLDKVRPEDEVFDYSLTNEERIQSGRFTLKERVWYIPLASAAGAYTRLTRTLTKNKKG